MKTNFLFSLFAALTLAAAVPLHAQSAGYSAEEKNRINQEIDSRLGWIGSNWEIAKTSKALKLPNYFAAESSRFFQPGPPAYAQQPEYAEIAGLASIVIPEEGAEIPSSLQTQIINAIVGSGGTVSENGSLVTATSGETIQFSGEYGYVLSPDLAAGLSKWLSGYSYISGGAISYSGGAFGGSGLGAIVGSGNLNSTIIHNAILYTPPPASSGNPVP